MSTTCPCTSLGWECELSWWWSSQRGSFSRPTLQKLYEEVKNIFQTRIPVSVREFLAAVASSTLSKVRKAKPRDWGIGNEIKSDLNFNLLPKEFWHALSPSWERSFVKLEIMMILQRKSTHLARFSVQDNLAFLKRPKPPKLLLQVPSWDQFSPWGLLDLGLSWGGRVKQWRMVMNLFSFTRCTSTCHNQPILSQLGLVKKALTLQIQFMALTFEIQHRALTLY